MTNQDINKREGDIKREKESGVVKGEMAPAPALVTQSDTIRIEQQYINFSRIYITPASQSCYFDSSHSIRCIDQSY